MNSQSMLKYFDFEVYPGKEIQSDRDLLNIARDRSTTAYHLVGTCKMGPNSDRFSVVENRLRVWGFDNLRVIDASIMPRIPSSNVNATVLAIAEKAAVDVIQAT